MSWGFLLSRRCSNLALPFQISKTDTETIISDLVPLRQRGQWFGIISGMWSIGSVTGPIVGGAFAQAVSWVRFEALSRLFAPN